MVANALLATIGVVPGDLFWLMEGLIVFASSKGTLSLNYGNIVLGGYQSTDPRKAGHRVLDQPGSAAEILSL